MLTQKNTSWVPKDLRPLREAIANALALHMKAYDLPSFCAEQLGLAPGSNEDAMRSKRIYVRERLPRELTDLTKLAHTALGHFDDLPLEQALAVLENNVNPDITEFTRRQIAKTLSALTNLSGDLELMEFLSRTVPVHKMAPDGSTQLVSVPASDDPWDFAVRTPTLADEVVRHCIHNDDWGIDDLLERIGLLKMSFDRLCKFLELLVHPIVREGAHQLALVTDLNKHLSADGFSLVAVSEVSTKPIFGIRRMNEGVSGSPKNLIFASSGPKPRIVLRDAINNDAEIVENAQHCLVYERALSEQGLLWEELVNWWQSKQQVASVEDARKQLGQRLLASLQSPPEREFFLEYFRVCRPMFQDKLPALIPQVYLHYDPFTVRELRERVVLARQRMDFLLLLAGRRRIVLEVDGQQHFAADGKPRPDLYAEMVSEDRLLRLKGYEVYRFGATELANGKAKDAVTTFFTKLFRRQG